jgi:dolichol-phosphate mannosyltransferase
VQAVLQTLRRASPEGFVVLIVDDNSPDGTGDLADRLAAEHGPVRVLHRPAKGGLGPAYLAGFAEALAGGAAYVMEMDADFSHDPADLPALLDAARNGADLVLGSRYVPGGGVADWGPVRRLVSRGGSWYARVILGLREHDLTGGFKCFRRATLETIDLDTVRSQGYAFQIELSYRATRRGLHVVEVPIVFRERRVGTSKMSARIALEAFWRVPQMRGWR